ncbi:hypothetical protein F4804DRAFT_255853 [Jackrogersella minutella]|nr:hypothetical protein F4804DRAFT_255853 [Jackrogersella minutella]
MRITVNVNNPDVEVPELQLINLDVSPDITLADLRSSIEAEGIPGPSQNIYHNGQLITDNSKTLQELSISDGDMLALHVRDMRGNTGVAPAHREPQRRQGTAISQDPELIRLQVLGDARLRSELERANPHSPPPFYSIINMRICHLHLRHGTPDLKGAMAYRDTTAGWGLGFDNHSIWLVEGASWGHWQGFCMRPGGIRKSR